MKKTIYIRRQDEPLWHRAADLLGDVSPLLSDLLRAWVNQKESELICEASERDRQMKAVLENIELKKRIAELEKQN